MPTNKRRSLRSKNKYKKGILPPKSISDQNRESIRPSHALYCKLTAKQHAMGGILPLVSLGALFLASTTASAPTDSATASATKLCVQLQIPVPVVATNYHYDQPQVDSSIDAMDWTVNVTTWSSSNFTARITGRVDINKTFEIGAQLCVPSQKTSKAGILQITTPGLGFGRELAMKPMTKVNYDGSLISL